ncbi:hypothetical protein HYH03_017627 [Edaphochlamys debaryana]|uniref:RDRP core domain-containing protein n=1 Tax=Edaphochlamys debaryana TaxID=47281 RepID=A0A836BNZ2_9CHLO|nr:hypothetical protein HYH03_017627 [Edaphochlamys debaryana]|eukprot:KAG2483520.1 hypothetical protein HYH03_017627 [Edaphochlamys debaryana]
MLSPVARSPTHLPAAPARADPACDRRREAKRVQLRAPGPPHWGSGAQGPSPSPDLTVAAGPGATSPAAITPAAHAAASFSSQTGPGPSPAPAGLAQAPRFASATQLLVVHLRAQAGPLPTCDGSEASCRAHLLAGLPTHSALLLDLLGLGPDGPSLDLLRGLARARSASELVTLVGFMAAAAARQRHASALAAATATATAATTPYGINGNRRGGGGGRASDAVSSQAAEKEAATAKRRAELLWQAMACSGLVWAPGDPKGLAGGGAVSYNPDPPQRPPYRVVTARLELPPAEEGFGSGGGSRNRRRGRDSSPGDGGGGGGGGRGGEVCAGGGEGWVELGDGVRARFDLELSPESTYLCRHPHLAAHDRLLRMTVRTRTRGGGGGGGSGGGGDSPGGGDSGGGGSEGLADGLSPGQRGALERVLSRGFVFAGRLYRYLTAKDGALWCVAVRSCRTADLQGWAPIAHPILDAWPLLGAAGCLPTVQKMAARAELWSSKTLPLALPEGWRVIYKSDPEGPHPTTPGATLPLTDGAGRASPDLWPLALAAVANHAAAAAAAAAKDAAAASCFAIGSQSYRQRGAGAAAGTAAAAAEAAAAAACGRLPPLQMRMYDRMLTCSPSYDRPSVMNKGLLIPDSSLPCRTIVLPYSCVKAPGIDTLLQWLEEAEDAALDVLPPTPPLSSSSSSSYPSHAAGPSHDAAAAAAGSAAAGNSSSSDGHTSYAPVRYSSRIQLELVGGGRPVRPGRLNQNLIPLLDHLGVPRRVLYGLLDAALAEARAALRTPSAAATAARSREGRFATLLERLGAGWGRAAEEAAGDVWAAPDAHLASELDSLLTTLINSLREMQIPLPDSLMAVGVPDPTASLPRRCVCLIDDAGRAVAAAPTRCLLYRDPELRHTGVLAAWLVPPPPGLLAGGGGEAGGAAAAGAAVGRSAGGGSRGGGLGPGLRSALVMPIQGGESLAALMAGGDYDGDIFHVITHRDMVDALWERLAAQQGVSTEPSTAAAQHAQHGAPPAPLGPPPTPPRAQHAQQAAWAAPQGLPTHAQHAGPSAVGAGAAWQAQGAEATASQAQARAVARGLPSTQAQSQPLPLAPTQPLPPCHPHPSHGGGQQQWQQQQQGSCQPSQQHQPLLGAMTPPPTQPLPTIQTPGSQGGRSGPSGPGPSQARVGPPGPRLPSMAEALASGQLWVFPPQRDDPDPSDLIRQLVQFWLHAQVVDASVGLFHTYWLRCLELHRGQGGGPGGPLCTQLAEGYEQALDAKKHQQRPSVPPAVERVCRQLNDPAWHRKNWQGMAADGTIRPAQHPAPSQAAGIQIPANLPEDPIWDEQALQPPPPRSVISDLFSRIQIEDPLLLVSYPHSGPGHGGPTYTGGLNGFGYYAAGPAAAVREMPLSDVVKAAASVEPDRRLVEAAQAVVGDEGAWLGLMEACWGVVQREWSEPWRRYLQAQEAGPRASSRDALRRSEEACAALLRSLVAGVRRGLLAAARGRLRGRLQLGDQVAPDAPPLASPTTPATPSAAPPTATADSLALDLRPRAALAVALYAAVYSRRAAAEGASLDGRRLGVVWAVAGRELNFAHVLLRAEGALPGLGLPRRT